MRVYTSLCTHRMLWLVVLFAGILGMGSSHASAANISSTKTGNWSDPSVWSGGVVPAATDNVTIVSPHIVTMNADGSVANLTVNSGGTLQFNSTTTPYTLALQPAGIVTVSGTLDLGILGTLVTGASGSTTLTMGSSANLITSNATTDAAGALGPGATSSLRTQGTGTWVLTSVGTAGTVTYKGTGSTPYVITDRNYNNLSLGSGGVFTWTLAADRAIAGTLLGPLSTRLFLVGTSNLFLGGNLNTQFSVSPAGFDQGGVTLVLNGSAAQFMNHNGPPLGTVTINKAAGTVTTFYASTVNGPFTITAGTFNPTHAFVFNGPVVNNGSFSPQALTFNGSFTNTGTFTPLGNQTFKGDFTNSGTFTTGGSTMFFSGTALQAIGGSGALTFAGMNVNNAAGVTLNRALTVSSTLTLTAGVLHLTNPLTMASASTISRFGAGSLNGSPTFAGTVNLIYGNSITAPTITPGSELPSSATALANFTVSGTTVHLDRDITVNGVLSLSGAAAVLHAGTFSITMNGSWANSASVTAFASGTGTVTFAGNANRTISGSSATTFNDLTVALGAANSLTLTTAPTVNGALTITGGSVMQSTGTLTLKGDLLNNAGATAYSGGSGTVSFAGPAAQSLGGTFPTSFYRLTLNNASGLTLGQNATVTNALTLTNGALATGPNMLILTSTGSVTRTSGFVTGQLQKNVASGSNVSRTFEIGSGGFYAPATVVFGSVSTAGNLVASTAGGEHPDIANSGLDASKDVNRSWTITNSGVGFSSYTATFTYGAADVDPLADPNTFEVRKKDGAVWSPTATGTRTATSTQATGLTSFSDFAVGTVIPTTPASPAPVAPANASVDRPVIDTLKWNAVYGATSYGVDVATDAGFATIVLTQTGITATTFGIPSALANSTMYYWRVNATNVAGTSGWSTPWSYTTIIAIPPAPVLTAPATGATEVPTTPTLTWSPAVGAATYRVQISLDPGFSSTVLDVAGIAGTSHPVSTPLGTSTQYYWRVNATNVGGTGVWSAGSGFTTVLATPDVPVLTAPADGATGVAVMPVLTWNAVPGVVTYKVQIATDAGFASIVLDSNITGVATLTPAAPLAASTGHYWRVNTTNSGGTSAWSTVWSFTTRAPTTITSTKTGNWSDPTVWNSGFVPGFGDAVTVATGHTVSMNASGNLSTLTVTGTLQFNSATPYTLAIAPGGIVMVNGTLDLGAQGILQSGGSGTTTLTMGSTGTLVTSNATADTLGALGPGPLSSLRNAGTGTWALPNMASAGTVTYKGSGTNPYVITDRSYNNLSMNSGGAWTWTLGADRTIAGTLLGPLSTRLFLVGTSSIFLGGNLNTQFSTSPAGFNQGGVTIVFNGTGSQFMNHNGPPLGNIVVNRVSGSVTTAYASTVNGSFTVTSGGFSPSYSFVFNGPVTINGSFTTSVAQTFKGNLTNNGTFTVGSASTTFSGTSQQTITGSAATTLAAATFNNPTGIAVNGTLTVGGTFTLGATPLSLAGGTLTLNGGVSVTTGSITSVAGATVNYNQATAGQAIVKGDYGNLTLSNANKTFPSAGPVRIAGVFTPGTATGHTLTGSTIEYNGTTAQTAPAGFASYNALVLSNPAGVSLNGNISLSGNLTVNGPVDPLATTFTFTGATAQTVAGPANAVLFNTTVNKTANGVTLATDLNVQGTLTLTSGLLTVADRTLGLSNPIAGVSTGLIAGGTSSIVIGGTVAGVVVPPHITALNGLTVNNASGSALQADMDLQGGLTLTSGYLIAGAHALTLRNPIAGTPTNLLADSTTTLTIDGSVPGIIIPSSVTGLSALTINNPAGVSLGGPLAVSGALTLTTGRLATGAHTLFAKGAVVDADSVSYVAGQLQRPVTTGASVIDFAIGDSAVYAPVQVTFANAISAGTLTGATVPTLPGPAATSVIDPVQNVKRTWSLTDSGVAGTYDALFTFAPSDVQGGANVAQLVGAKYDSSWSYPTVGSRTATSVGLTGMDSFSDFILGISSPTTTAPVITTPIAAGATSVTGTSSEADGTVIQVYVNGSPLGSTTTVTTNAWTMSGMTALVAGDLVKATALATGKLLSVFSNEVTVSAVTTAPTVASPILAGATTVSGTSAEADGAVITVYVNGFPLGSTTTVTSNAWLLAGVTALNGGDLVTATALASGKLVSEVSDEVTVLGATVANVKVFLQGPFVLDSMTTALHAASFIPHQHPYGIAPWSYTGTDSVSAVPAGVVDWVLVDLRSDSLGASTVASRAALLKSNGTVVDLDGSSPVHFPGLMPGSYYVVVRHRNHLAVMSAATLTLNATSTLYDFTSSLTQYYGGDAKEVATGVFGMWAGDVTGNGIVKYSGSANDRSPILTRIGGSDLTLTVSGYHPEDVNMNGQVKYSGSANDRSIILQTVGGADMTATRSSNVPN